MCIIFLMEDIWRIWECKNTILFVLIRFRLSLLQVNNLKTIISFDAGEDPHITLSSLSDVLNLAEEEGVISSWKIIEPPLFNNILPIGPNLPKKLRNTVLKVVVKKPDPVNKENETEVTIYYTKMALQSEEEDDVLKLYSLADSTFPNHPTSNQFFYSRLFRAYHKLGLQRGSVFVQS